MDPTARQPTAGPVGRRGYVLAMVCAAALIAGAAFYAGLIVTPRRHLAIVEAARRELRDGYVDPKVAQELDRVLQQQIAGGEHGGFSNAASLMMGLTSSLREVAHDRHIFVGYSLTKVRLGGERTPTREELAKESRRESADNFGLRRVEEMAGNVGYIELSRFADPEWAEQALAAAMERVHGTSALIIDLRDNHGGSPAMGVLLASYFFPQPVHWVDFHSRAGVAERWTQASVKGPRYLEKPLVLLTSRHTFSAAEGFAYHMKNLRRAVVIGGRTAGGANPGVRKRLDEHYWIFVPTARAVSPITHSNWEHVGVAPDVEVAAEDALKAALERVRLAADSVAR